MSGQYLFSIWIYTIVDNKSLPKNLKLAGKTPIVEKDDATVAKNYRPVVSVLPCVSKSFERIILNQLIPYIDQYL